MRHIGVCMGSSAAVLTWAGMAAATWAAQPDDSKPRPAPEIAQFRVRQGYVVSVAVDALRGSRFLEFDDHGRLFVSRPGAGDIICLTDADRDGYFEERAIFVGGKPSVHGLCFAHGWLYYTTTNTIERARDLNADGEADEKEEIIGATQLPGGGAHWWRSILVTADAIYTSIGDSGNASDETTSDRQKIWKWNLAGTHKTLFASGIRNNEKLRFRPGTSEIWGCDHGSDQFGASLGETDSQPITDLNPPCEFNRYVQDAFYGHPFVVGMRNPRPEYRAHPQLIDFARRTMPPEWAFGAHWSPNGFCFVDPEINQRSRAFPDDHAGDAFVAFHGSWNSSVRVGYQVARVRFDRDPVLGGHPCGLEPIVVTIPAVGSADGDAVFGRPVDCAQAPDGSIVFSDDFNGKVYRIRWKP